MTKNDFVDYFFSQLNIKSINYMILRNYEVLPFVSNDIDILLELSGPDVIKLIDDITCGTDWEICNVIERTCLAIYVRNRVSMEGIHLDFFTSIKWHWINLIDFSTAYDGVRNFRNYIIPNMEIELLSKLLARLLPHGYIKNDYKIEIASKINLVCKNRLYYYFSRILGTNCAKIYTDMFINLEFDKFESLVWQLRFRIVLHQLLNSPHAFVKEFNKNALRKVKRLFKPSGCVISLIGPDGSGKSTVIDAASKYYKDLYGKDKVKYYHWRPNLLKTKGQNSKHVTFENPHNKAPYNLLISLLRFHYFHIDYILGYLVKVYPEIVKGSIVIFDRYYDDFYIDQKRYRLKIPNWYIKAFENTVPKAKLRIALIGNANVLYERKSEIPREEIQRQCNSIMELSENKTYHIIRTDITLDETLSILYKIIKGDI